MAEARKLLERATDYKEEAKRQHEKVGGWQLGFECSYSLSLLQMKEKWRRETLEEAEKTEPLEQVKRVSSLV